LSGEDIYIEEDHEQTTRKENAQKYHLQNNRKIPHTKTFFSHTIFSCLSNCIHTFPDRDILGACAKRAGGAIGGPLTVWVLVTAVSLAGARRAIPAVDANFGRAIANVVSETAVRVRPALVPIADDVR